MLVLRWATVLFLLFFIFITLESQKLDIKNVFNQYLPKCSNGYDRIQKQTQAKAILCPMFRDEEGFLSEWVAYYQMHGFDHIIMFDDGSTDNSLIELKPWIDSGFVSIKSNWTAEGLRISPKLKKAPFERAMHIKALLERDCKLQAMQWGYDFFFSLDIDEYVIPTHPNTTIVDELFQARKDTDKSQYCVAKHNYVSTPHTLEPVHLLTIEAYQHRNPRPGKMSYYTSVAYKCAYALNHTTFTPNTAEYIAYCCFFHGCDGTDRTAGKRICLRGVREGEYDLIRKGTSQTRKKRRSHVDIGVINHYSRSLEKYALKSKTWKTASGEIGASNYNVAGFLARNIGWKLDPIALRYTCQLREQLRIMTGIDPYLRPGGIWYRNAEFGKDITSPEKRGRYGRPNSPGFKYWDGNPYHYHGEGYQTTHLHIDKAP